MATRRTTTQETQKESLQDKAKRLCKEAVKGTSKSGLEYMDITLDRIVALRLYFQNDDSKNDFGQIVVNNFGINVNVMQGKNGAFLSYPSYKNSKGEYVNLVSCYDKDMNALIKTVLEYLYE